MLTKRSDINNWEQYNKTLKNSSEPIALIPINGKEHLDYSYTDIYFKMFNLSEYMNDECKAMLQLGAANGNFLNIFANKGWNTIGYDYSKTAIDVMSKKGILAREIDLDSMQQNRLSYESELATDLNTPTNIFAIRVLEYLEPQALTLLMFNLINKAKPGSVFFMSSYMTLKEDGNSTTSSSLKYNYIMSFFAPRTDITILKHTKTPDAINNTVKNRQDEIIIVRKTL